MPPRGSSVVSRSRRAVPRSPRSSCPAATAHERALIDHDPAIDDGGRCDAACAPARPRGSTARCRARWSCRRRSADRAPAASLWRGCRAPGGPATETQCVPGTQPRRRSLKLGSDVTGDSFHGPSSRLGSDVAVIPSMREPSNLGSDVTATPSTGRPPEAQPQALIAARADQQGAADVLAEDDPHVNQHALRLVRLDRKPRVTSRLAVPGSTHERTTSTSMGGGKPMRPIASMTEAAPLRTPAPARPDRCGGGRRDCGPARPAWRTPTGSTRAPSCELAGSTRRRPRARASGSAARGRGRAAR